MILTEFNTLGYFLARWPTLICSFPHVISRFGRFLLIVAFLPTPSSIVYFPLSGQHGSSRRSSSRSWWWVLVATAAVTGCIVSIGWAVTPQPSRVNTPNRWRDFVRTRGNLRPPPAHWSDQELSSALDEVGCTAAVNR